MARARLFNGIEMTEGKRAALAALADFPDGTGPLTIGPLGGGTLSALSMMGLARRERIAGEGWRYRISPEGKRVLSHG